MEVLRFNSEMAKEKAAEEIGVLLSRTKVPVLLMLSGGSAFKILDHIDMRNINSHVTITVLDERFSKDVKVNNFSQLMETTFGQVAAIRKASFIDTRVAEGEDLRMLADRFEKSVRQWEKDNKNGEIVVTQGIGSDGHTAGIMPYPEDKDKFIDLFGGKNDWIIGYNAGDKNQYPERITVTPSFLKDEVDHSIVFVGGEEKRNALDRIIFEKGAEYDTPATIIRGMKDVKIFTDIV
ncbi:MAG TPA: 6-phosphogluconolactonase [Candidatus Paceibacterota bacterium]